MMPQAMMPQADLRYHPLCYHAHALGTQHQLPTKGLSEDVVEGEIVAHVQREANTSGRGEVMLGAMMLL